MCPSLSISIKINADELGANTFISGETVRLVDGFRAGEGRVEMFHDGHWGTVCDDSWDIRDAEVVCRQFGYSRAHLAAHTSLFGQGNGHIWVDEVNCIGNETSLDECTHAGWNNHDCSHYEDASVICSNDTAFYFGECCVVTMSLCVNCIVSVPFLPLSVPFSRGGVAFLKCLKIGH